MQHRMPWAKAVVAAVTTHVKLAGEAADARVAAAPSERPKGGARVERHRFSGVLPCRPPELHRRAGARKIPPMHHFPISPLFTCLAVSPKRG